MILDFLKIKKTKTKETQHQLGLKKQIERIVKKYKNDTTLNLDNGISKEQAAISELLSFNDKRATEAIIDIIYANTDQRKEERIVQETIPLLEKAVGGASALGEYIIRQKNTVDFAKALLNYPPNHKLYVKTYEDQAIAAIVKSGDKDTIEILKEVFKCHPEKTINALKEIYTPEAIETIFDLTKVEYSGKGLTTESAKGINSLVDLFEQANNEPDQNEIKNIIRETTEKWVNKLLVTPALIHALEGGQWIAKHGGPSNSGTYTISYKEGSPEKHMAPPTDEIIKRIQNGLDRAEKNYMLGNRKPSMIFLEASYIAEEITDKRKKLAEKISIEFGPKPLTPKL